MQHADKALHPDTIHVLLAPTSAEALRTSLFFSFAPLCLGVIAYKNALMRRVYVHESMKKFIDRAKADGSVELHVIRGDVDPESAFAKFGKLVFELYYRCDLETFS